MDTTVLRAGPADVIAHVFYTLGYRPRESLVLVGLHGSRLRLGLSVRVDLPPSRHARLPLEQPLKALRDHGDDAAIVLVISDRPGRQRRGAPQGPPYGYLARDVRRRLLAAGVRVWDVLAVGESSYQSYLCDDPECCPPAGRPLTDVTDSVLAAWMVSQGRAVAPDEASLLAFVDPAPESAPAVPLDSATDPATGSDPATDPATDTATDTASDTATDTATDPATDPAGGPPAGPAPEPAREAAGVAVASESAKQSLKRWRALLHDDSQPWPPVARDAGAELPDLRWLASALQDHRFRDAVLLTLVPGTESVADEALSGADAPAIEELFNAPPDDALLGRGTTLLAAVARTAPPGQRADALALLAWAAWWAGHGPRGRLLAARALADQPANTLAALVEQLLFVGIAPGWTRESRAG